MFLALFIVAGGHIVTEFVSWANHKRQIRQVKESSSFDKSNIEFGGGKQGS
jgi:hypothetical protein